MTLIIVAPIRSGLVDACTGEPRVRGLHGPLGFCRASRAFSAAFYARARPAAAGPTAGFKLAAVGHLKRAAGTDPAEVGGGQWSFYGWGRADISQLRDISRTNALRFGTRF